MQILFVHQNFPAQYKYLGRHYAANPKHRAACLAKTELPIPPNMKRVLYKAKETGPGTHGYIRGFEDAVRHGEAAAAAVQDLKKSGFRPDIVCVHPGWGESLYLKDVLPDVPQLHFCEFHFHPFGGAIHFDPKEPVRLDSLARTRLRNTVNLLSLEDMTWGVAPTFWQHSQYPAEHGGRISILHDGVDVRVCAPNPKASVKLPDGSVLRVGDEVVTYVSRNLEPVRGFPTFARAAGELLRRRPACRILVVGGDNVSYGAKLPEGESWRKKMLEEVPLDPARVHFLGRVGYMTFLRILQISSAHVYLTMPFVLSWSMLEAMAAGCLVVGSNTAAVTEAIEDGRNGLLTDFFDPLQVADRVCEALDHPDRMQALRREARKTVLERYDLRWCLPGQIRLIEDVAAGRRPQVETYPPPGWRPDQAAGRPAGASARVPAAPATPAPAAAAASRPAPAEPATLAFVVCVERGRREGEAIGLVRSLRRFGGPLEDRPVLALAPRRGLEPSRATLEALAGLGVEQRSVPLDERYRGQAPADKVFAAAYAEEQLDADVLVLLDSDSAFLDAPTALLLDSGHDGGAVPVYRKGIGSTGIDRQARFWDQLYRMCDVTRRQWVRTGCEGIPVLAYWESGLVSVRRSAGTFRRWRELFERAAGRRAELALAPADHRWLEQATLAAALATAPRPCRQLPATYGYPILMHRSLAPDYRLRDPDTLVSVRGAGRAEERAPGTSPFDGAERSSRKLRYLLEEAWPAKDGRRAASA